MSGRPCLGTSPFPYEGRGRWPAYARPLHGTTPPTHHLPTPPSLHRPSFAAAQRPSILVPGANHAQSAFLPPPPPPAPGAPPAAPPPPAPGARGDIPATVTVDQAVDGLGRAIGAFMVANGSGVEGEARAGAVGALQGMCGETAEMVQPWFEASGGWEFEVWGLGGLCSAV